MFYLDIHADQSKEDAEIKSGQWFGVTLQSGGKDRHIIVRFVLLLVCLV